MGKDQELLDAARNGNITLIEKILNQRGKRSGPLASLRRGPGANMQDSAGYSALHYASLNGHFECVRLLLMHEASANLPDSRGSSPLHLAAWAGHQDIVKLLLTQSNRPANPNLQTIDNETPLHLAAMHGHTGALTTLLAHGANPNVVNNRGEKPLDLAAQFGRLQVVQMLVRAHPELIHPYKKNCEKTRGIYTHTPLHLSAKNGHKHVVEVLLAAGVDVNILTSAGTALHEAALCGKDSVVKILLEFGADLDITDSEGRTALDLLKQFPPHVTRGIVSVINNYKNSLALSSSEQEDILKVSRNIPFRESYYDDQSYHSHGMRESHAWSSYSNDANSMLESPSSSVGSLDPASPRMRTGGDNNSGFYVTMTPLNSNSKLSPTPPKKPPRRNLSISPSTTKSLVSARSNISGSSSQTSPYEYLYLAQSGDRKMVMNKAASMDQCQNYVKMMSPSAKEKHEAVLKQMSEHLMNSTGDDGEPIPAAPLRSYNPNRKLRRIRDNYDGYSQTYNQNGSRYGNNHNNDNGIPMSPSNYRQPPTPDHPPPNAQTAEKIILERIRPLSQEYRRSIAMLEYMRHSQNGTSTFGGYENRHRINSEKRVKHQSASQPSNQMSNHHYHHHHHHHHHRQSYQENVVPPPQLYSNRSRQRISNNRDSSLSPCSSDVIMSHSLYASSGSLSSVSSDRSASTDCVEYVTDVPFAGLFKGSTMTLDNPNLITYGTSNLNSDYKYYQSMAPAQLHQPQQQQQQHNKSNRSPANNNSLTKCHQVPEVQSHKTVQSQHLPKPISQYHHRPERPKTLDTQSPLDAFKSNAFNSTSSQSPINNSNQAKTPISEDEHRTDNIRNGRISDSSTNAQLLVPNAIVLSQKLSSDCSEKIMAFDEQEEWKKISEIMANFGTDSDVLQEPMNNSNRRHDYQNRIENGRNNSIAGFTFNDIDNHRNAMNSTESVNSNVQQRRSGSQSPYSQLIQFLYDNELNELSNILYDNGYDDIDFIKGILDENDLETLDIKPELREKLMAAIENDLQKPIRTIIAFNKTIGDTKSNAYHSMDTNHEKQITNSINDTDAANNLNHNNNSYSTILKKKGLNSDDANGMVTVNDWLESIRLSHYAETFRKHLYTDMERISRIWEIELQAVLEINKIGHRKRILYSVGATPPKNTDKFEKFTKSLNDVKRNTSSSQRSSLSISSHDSKDGVVEHRPNYRKNRQAPKPPTQQPKSIDENNLNNLIESTSNLEIRAPSELLLGFPPNLRTQWRHSAEVLITSAVKYEVNYLGSTVIKELRGTESTKKSIQKLKKSEKILGVNAISNNDAFATNLHQNTKQAVFILISYRGVQFVDPQTQGMICEHEIRNINCACQDADDLSHFAYITKDSDTHYCHVFNVISMDLATEIILTLGQAFEVAYQIALRKSTPTTPIRSPVNSSNSQLK